MGKARGDVELTQAQRQQIIRLRGLGFSYRDIAYQVGCCKSVVGNWIHRHIQGGNTETMPRTGPPRLSTPRQDRQLVRDARRNPFLLPKHHQVTMQQHGQAVCRMTVRRRLTDAGLFGRIAAKKDILTPAHKQQRLAFAQAHRHWTVDQWRNVGFTDEKVFQIAECGQVWCRRLVGTRYDSQNIKTCQRSGRYSVNIWGWMDSHGNGSLHRILGRFNQHQYRGILEAHLPDMQRHIPNGFVFQHDRSPIHTARMIQGFLQAQPFQVIDWPPKGCDMNPIENA